MTTAIVGVGNIGRTVAEHLADGDKESCLQPPNRQMRSPRNSAT
jgi:Trk K+ transport system NAD-binding subunit